MTKHVLLMDGPDAKGLIFQVTSVLFEQACNIIRQDEYVSPSGQFFMRTELESDENLDSNSLLKALRQRIPDESITFRINPKKKKDIVILATKEHHCLSDLLTRYHFDELNANVLAVISNYNVLQPYVSKFGVPFHYIAHEDKTREEHEEAILRTLSIYKPAYLVLAKYMRVLTPGFVAHYPNQIINIHHSFLPAFPGAKPYHSAFKRGVKIIGATSHYVTEELDEGPIIEQDITRVSHDQSIDDFIIKGRDLEKIVLSRALKLHAERKTMVFSNKTIIFS